MKPIQVTDSTFNSEVLSSDQVVLVDFWAPWCAPCKMIAPIVEEIAQEMDGVVKIAKLNTDENQETAARYGIRGIPTLGIYKNGEMIDSIVGVVPKSMITDKLNYYAAVNA
jgi:thioredoxin 1